MAGRGRPNNYLERVKPRLGEIYEWLSAGATEKEVCENLGINNKVFCKYKTDYPELNELVKKSRRKPVMEIKASLFKKACGFYYTEMIKTESERHGTTVQTFKKYAVPDATSALILLKHWDTETEWTADPATLRLKKEEFELKKQHMESEDW